MEKYLIFMDVSGDVDPEVAQEYELKFLPMDYTLGNNMRKCEKMEDKDTLKLFYDGQRKGDFTKTTQISPYMYEEFMTPYFEEGYSVLYISLSGGLSSTYESACHAKKELKKKYPAQDFYVVNSLAATGGMGVLVERAIRNKKNGLSAKQNFDDLTFATHRLKHWFMVQDLNYLKRGGRISAATAAMGTMLNVRPILKIDEEGKLVTIAKKRGDKAAARELLDRFAETYDPGMGDAIYIIDADNNEIAAVIQEKLETMYPNAVIRRSMLSPIIGAHTGPGMVAICHMGK